MKKWMKGLLIAAGCLTAAGLVLTGVGYAAGGFSHAPRAAGEEADSAYSHQLSPEGIRSLEIEWVSGQVIVEPWDQEEIQIEERGYGPISDKNRLEYKVKGDSLEISFLKPGFHLNFWLQEKDLYVRLPRELAESLESLDIENVSAELQLSGLKVQDMEVNTVSGGLKGENMQAEELEFESVSGNLNTAFQNLPQDMELKTVSGNAEIYLPEGSAVRAELDSVSGQCESELPGTAGEEAAEINMSSVSGSLHIRKAR